MISRVNRKVKHPQLENPKRRVDLVMGRGSRGIGTLIGTLEQMLKTLQRMEGKR